MKYHNVPSEDSPAHNVGFGGGFTPGQLVSTGVISFGIAKVLGASVPGALVMGFGNMLWEAGSGNIPGGWRRYVLGLFRKPEALAAGVRLTADDG